MKLNQLKVGQSCVIVKINLPKKIKERLFNMGLREGIVAKIIRFAPLNDPIELEIKQYLLAVRKADAKKIEVLVNNEKR